MTTPNQTQTDTPGSLHPDGSAGDALPCGCPDATIRTTREFESMGDEDWMTVYHGFTCRCGKSFYAEPKRQNEKLSHGLGTQTHE